MSMILFDSYKMNLLLFALWQGNILLYHEGRTFNGRTVVNEIAQIRGALGFVKLFRDNLVF